MWEELFIKKNKALLIELGAQNNQRSWLGLFHPYELDAAMQKSKFEHFITIDLSSVFANMKNQSISIFFSNTRELAKWTYLIHPAISFDKKETIQLKFEDPIPDENPIEWMKKAGYGIQRSKIGGKPSFIQDDIETTKIFFLQINWEDLIFNANEILGENFDIVSEAFMGGNIYLFAPIDTANKEINSDKVDIYHQYS
jgi:hypothetical protein